MKILNNYARQQVKEQSLAAAQQAGDPTAVRRELEKAISL